MSLRPDPTDITSAQMATAASKPTPPLLPAVDDHRDGAQVAFGDRVAAHGDRRQVEAWTTLEPWHPSARSPAGREGMTRDALAGLRGIVAAFRDLAHQAGTLIGTESRIGPKATYGVFDNVGNRRALESLHRLAGRAGKLLGLVEREDQYLEFVGWVFEKAPYYATTTVSSFAESTANGMRRSESWTCREIINFAEAAHLALQSHVAESSSTAEAGSTEHPPLALAHALDRLGAVCGQAGRFLEEISEDRRRAAEMDAAMLSAMSRANGGRLPEGVDRAPPGGAPPEYVAVIQRELLQPGLKYCEQGKTALLEGGASGLDAAGLPADRPISISTGLSKAASTLAIVEALIRQPDVQFDDAASTLTSLGEDFGRYRDELLAAIKILRARQGDLKQAKTPLEDSIPHGDDFTWMIVGGQRYSFKKGLEAECIRHLFLAWVKSGGADGCGMSECVLGEKAGSSATPFRLTKVLGGHSAWGTLIRSVEKGTFALFLNSHENPIT